MKKNVIRLFWAVFILALLALVGYILVIKGIIRFNYPSKAVYPVQGIDVSHHQGKIDWYRVKNDEVSFAIIKATEGGDFRDKRFAENWKKAKEAGVIVGGYHYFSFCKSGEEQASNFIHTVPNEPGTLPPSIDLEYDKNCNGSIAIWKLQKELKVYISTVKDHYGKDPIIYCNEAFYKKYLRAVAFKDCLIWVRNTVREPSLSDNRNWFFWQYSAKGSIDGVEGFVDLNVYQGEQNEFGSLLR